MTETKARQLLSARLSECRALPYRHWAAQVDQAPLVFGGPAVAGVPAYTIEIQALWDDAEGGNIRVVADIDVGGLTMLKPYCEDFIIAPDSRFVGE